MGRKEQGRLTVKVRGQFTFEIDPDLDSETLMRAAVQVFLADPLRYIEFSPNPTSRSRVEQYKALRANGIGAPPKSRANEPLDTHARVSAIQIDFATGRYMMPPGFAQSMAASQSAPLPLPPVADEEDAGEGEAAGDAPVETSGPDDDENDPSAVGGIKLRFSTTASVQAAAADEDARDEEVAAQEDDAEPSAPDEDARDEEVAAQEDDAEPSAPDADEPRDEEASPQLSTGSIEAPHEAMEYGQDAQRPLESATHHVADDVPPVAGGGAPVEHDEGDRHGRKIKIVEEERPWLPPGLQRPTVLKAPPRD